MTYSNPVPFLAPLLPAMLAGLLPAQVVPFGFDNHEGDHVALTLGLTPEFRYQFAEAGLRGKVTFIRRISYRPEGAFVVLTAPLKSPGRSWTNVQLRISDCDIQKLSTTYASNSLNTPTLLFSAKVDWPDQANTSTASPRAFEAALSFPLLGPYVSSGQNDLLLDYAFRGGTLKNNVNWAKINANPYILDGGDPREIWFTQSTPTVLGNQKCKDPGAFFGPTGLQAIATASRRNGTPVPSQANQFTLAMRTDATAPLAMVLHAVGVSGSTAGIPIGACNRLYISPVLHVPRLADGSGNASTNVAAPYRAGLVGVPLWLQAAWTNSQTGGFEVTNAVTLALPRQPPPPPDRCMLLTHFNANATVSAGPPSRRPEDLPVILYASK